MRRRLEPGQQFRCTRVYEVMNGHAREHLHQARRAPVGPGAKWWRVPRKRPNDVKNTTFGRSATQRRHCLLSYPALQVERFGQAFDEPGFVGTNAESILKNS